MSWCILIKRYSLIITEMTKNREPPPPLRTSQNYARLDCLYDLKNRGMDTACLPQWPGRQQPTPSPLHQMVGPAPNRDRALLLLSWLPRTANYYYTCCTWMRQQLPPAAACALCMHIWSSEVCLFGYRLRLILPWKIMISCSMVYRDVLNEVIVTLYSD